MKINIAPAVRRQLMPGIGILFTIMAVQACSKKIHFNNSTVVPAADGTIQVNKDHNGNYSIKIKVLHLAPPEKLIPAKKIYVVWVETENNGAKNIGQLNTSGSTFSSTLKASLQTVTSFHPLKIFVTAEDEGAITYPGPQVILISSSF
jgi:hypothetical protein